MSARYLEVQFIAGMLADEPSGENIRASAAYLDVIHRGPGAHCKVLHHDVKRNDNS
jgi:hypothetical protein